MLKKKSFIVSCQALQEEELFGEGIMVKMAKAALNGGSDAIRTSQVDNITDIMKAFPEIDVIGLIKKDYDGSDVRITPTIKELDELIKTNVSIVAIDATLRQRPKESLEELIAHFRKHKFKHQLLMADCATIEDVKNAIKNNFDIIGTTLRGATKETKHLNNHENDYEFLREIKKLTDIYLVAEGGLNTPLLAANALKYADAVVVGSAITRPRFITEMFCEEIKKFK